MLPALGCKTKLLAIVLAIRLVLVNLNYNCWWATSAEFVEYLIHRRAFQKTSFFQVSN